MGLTYQANGERVWQHIMELAEIGRTGEGVTRLSLTPEDLKARERLIEWMREAGLHVRVDGAGNIIGRLDGLDPTLTPVMAGSHIDSVLNGGKFDGPLGVLGALEAVRVISEHGIPIQRSIEIVSFTDEEGARFPAGFIGSKGMVGALTTHDLQHLRDAAGVSYDEAFRAAGLDPTSYSEAKREKDSVYAYVELHIEQGKVLERENLPVGIVTHIAGPMWIEVTVRGEAGHAGTTPMNLRHDAGLGAAELMLFVEQVAKQNGGVGTIGRLQLSPGGTNIIPGTATLTIDLRHTDKETRDEMASLIQAKAYSICESRGLELDWTVKQAVDPVPCSPRIVNVAESACQACGFPYKRMVSGAGHDAMILSQITDVAMIFVRSKDGISHNPKEWSSLEDVTCGVNVLLETIVRLANES
jgi:allantoate deiminase